MSRYAVVVVSLLLLAVGIYFAQNGDWTKSKSSPQQQQQQPTSVVLPLNLVDKVKQQSLPPDSQASSSPPVIVDQPKQQHQQQQQPSGLLPFVATQQVAAVSPSCAALLVTNVTYVISSSGGIRRCGGAARRKPQQQEEQQQQQASKKPKKQLLQLPDAMQDEDGGSTLWPIPACPIDTKKPSYRATIRSLSSRMCDELGQPKPELCTKTFDIALVGDLFRPQHAMQFLFSLMGVVAVQSALNLYHKDVPVFLHVMRYGAVGYIENFCRTSFPHFQLLDLLSPATEEQQQERSNSPSQRSATNTTTFSVSNNVFLIRDYAWREYSLRGPDLAVQASPRDSPGGIASWCVPESKIGDDRSAGATKFCVKKQLVVGSVPVRIPGKRSRIDPHLKAEAFQDFRQRMINRWNLHEVETETPYILFVQRKAQNARKLHNETVIIHTVQKALAKLDNNTINGSNNKVPVKFVMWENMPLVDQLRVALGARAMIGTHGNGLVWACFMRRGSFIIEFSSNINSRNELYEGINVPNAGNIASGCDMKSLSIRAPYLENEMTKFGGAVVPKHRRWKFVDVFVGERELGMIAKFITSNGTVA